MTKLVYNGRVYLARNAFCEALLIDEGRIVRTGSNRELLDETPAGAQRIDAGGALVLPAFHDSHLHLMWIGRRAGGIDGTGAKSIDEVVNRGRELIARLRPPPGACIQGAGVNPDLFTAGQKRDLRREDVDRISTEYPVIISRHCGHTIFCNSPALKQAGLSESAPEVEGGTIERDGDGRPTGILRENANALVRGIIPPDTRSDMKGFLKLGMERALSLGITALGSNDSDGSDFDTLRDIYREVYDEAREARRPMPRVTMQCGIDADFPWRGIPTGTPLWEHPQWGARL
jgi:predicted amidohydrolase YtcJ